MISINKPARKPNHTAANTGAVDRYVVKLFTLPPKV
uniref:Subunit IX of photosystem I n=1 Tax=Cymbomonas tetramitiformis TaxID=36881 RepID=A0A166QJ49_9CHLO|nr:subunit IX of photosystem I [Cymbomonas tetramitiformis]ANA56928.1 subunit IX of photosystem I [Cymbomonas tetramitiformis]